MAQNQSHETEQSTQIEIRYVRGGAYADEPAIEPDSDDFELTRDLSGFGVDAFERRDEDVDEILERGYVSLFDFNVDVELETDDDVRELLNEIYSRLQGPRVDEQIGYDGSEVRSMCTTDVVLVDGVPWIVVPFVGFQRLADAVDELQDEDDQDEDDEGDFPSLICDGGHDEPIPLGSVVEVIQDGETFVRGTVAKRESEAGRRCYLIDDGDPDGLAEIWERGDREIRVLDEGKGEDVDHAVGDRVLATLRGAPGGTNRRTGEVIAIQDREGVDGLEYVVDLDGSGQAHVTSHAIASVDDAVLVDRDVLAELVDVANGDLERLIGEGYKPDDDLIVELGSTVDAAQQALDG